MRRAVRGSPSLFLLGGIVTLAFLFASPGGAATASSVPNGAITIGTTTAASLATGYDYQGYTCVANSYFWAFYLTGSGWVYESSVDGISWSAPVPITLSASTTGGNVAFLCTSSSVTYVATQYSPSDGNFYVATGTFGAGTISWGGEVAVPTSNSNVGSPTVTTDSSGNLWVAVSTLRNGVYYIQVLEHTSGGWSQVQQLSNEQYAKLVALTGGKMALLFSVGTSSSISIETWSGVSWSSPVQTSSSTGSNSLNLERSSATALGDTVEFTFAIGPEGYFLQYTYGGTGWTGAGGGATPIDIGDADYMTIAADGTNTLAITMIDLTGEVYYSISTDGGAHWTAQSAISTSEGSASWIDSSFGFAYGGYDVVWMAQATGTTYNVRFARVQTFNPITIVLTSQNGAPTATFSISGCQVFPTTIPGDGAPHTVYSAGSCTMTLSGPADGTTTRYRFAGGAASQSIPGCGTGSCPSYSYSYFEQLYETYRAQAQAPNVFDSGLTGPAITGLVGGAASSNVCTMSIAGGSFTGTCSGWVDYAQVSSFGTISVSQPNTRWQPSGSCAFTDTTGGNTHTCSYYRQSSFNADYCLGTPGSISSPPALTFTALGASGSLSLTQSPQLVWADSGTSASVPATISGTSPADRWVTTTPTSPVGAGITFCPSYYHQYQVTLGYSAVGSGNQTPPTFMASQTGAPFTQTLSLAPTPYWFDAGASWSVTNPLAGSTSLEQWATNQPTTGTLSAGQSLQFTYYHQYALFNDNSMGITASTDGSTSTSSSTQQWVDQSSHLTIAGTFTFNTRMPNFAYYVYQGTTGFQVLTNTTVTNITYVNSVPIYAKFDASHCNCSMFIPPALNMHPAGLTDDGNSVPYNWRTPPGILNWFGSSTFQALLARVGGAGPSPFPNPFTFPLDFILDYVALALAVVLLIVAILGGREMREYRKSEVPPGGERAQ